VPVVNYPCKVLTAVFLVANGSWIRYEKVMVLRAPGLLLHRKEYFFFVWTFILEYSSVFFFYSLDRKPSLFFFLEKRTVTLSIFFLVYPGIQCRIRYPGIFF
jgi:hypothetical protein